MGGVYDHQSNRYYLCRYAGEPEHGTVTLVPEQTEHLAGCRERLKTQLGYIPLVDALERAAAPMNYLVTPSTRCCPAFRLGNGGARYRPWCAPRYSSEPASFIRWGPKERRLIAC